MKQNTYNTFFIKLLALCAIIALTGLGFFVVYYTTERNTPAYRAYQTVLDQQGTICRALFSPDDNVEETLVGLIDAEKSHISVAIFSLTNCAIIKALIDAKKRGVTIEVVVDRENSKNGYSKVWVLKKNRFSLWSYPQDGLSNSPDVGIMHNKFMIFSSSIAQRAILWTGSFNFTASANDRNQENVIVTDNPGIVSAYQRQFELLKQRSSRISQ